PDFGPAYYQLYRLYREKGAIEKSVEAQQAHARIQASEREQVTRKLLLDVRQGGALLSTGSHYCSSCSAAQSELRSSQRGISSRHSMPSAGVISCELKAKRKPVCRSI